MSGKAFTKEPIKKDTIQKMTKLCIYKPEYDATIEIYAELREQYERLTKEFKDSNYKKYKTYTENGGEKKSALISTLESLRKDILQYSSQLGLTPSGLKKINEKNIDDDKNLLEEALLKFE